MRNLHLFQNIIKHNITPSDYYLLLCIATKTTIQVVNGHQSLRSLRSEKLVKDDKLEITEKGKELIEELEGIFIGKEDGKDYITEYLEIFPGIRLPSGKLARGNYRDIEDAFHWFFKNYKGYTWDTILKATRHYVQEYALKDYQFMRTAKYFIKKADSTRANSSELADYCAIIVSGNYKDAIDNNFNESVT